MQVLGLLEQLLSGQNPEKKHSVLTRVMVCAIILSAFVILYGFYGLVASVAFYLIGVELIGLPLGWALAPLPLSALIGAWKGGAGVRDYLANYGHESA